MAVAAIAASLLLTRTREERETTGLLRSADSMPGRLQLDAIRAAGL